MNDDSTIKIGTLSSRAAPAVIAVIAISLAWVSIPAQFGNLLAETTSVLSPNAKEVAELARSLAGDDPQTRNMFALTRDDPNEVVEVMESSVVNAPHDPRWRIALGRAYEQTGQFEKAEIQFRKAVELAPNHSSPHWHFGNFYLRQEREEDAFTELKAATAEHAKFRQQVFSLIWD